MDGLILPVALTDTPDTGGERFFDSHAHYDDPHFSGQADSLLKELLQGPVAGIVNAGTDAASSRASLAMAEAHPGVYAAVGLHPQDCGEADETEWEEICRLLTHPKAVAIGEIGLDYHYEEPPRAVQEHWFCRQLSLAQETGCPVVIHDREAHGRCLELVRAYKGVSGVFHSFSGSAEMAAELVKLGWYLSFSGVVSFKNASRVLDAVRAVPDDRILIETDCPYLTPHPYRGKINHSGYLCYTAAAAAAARGQTLPDFVRMTRENALRLFRIPH